MCMDMFINAIMFAYLYAIYSALVILVYNED